jgi:hypothetical protein
LTQGANKSKIRGDRDMSATFTAYSQKQLRKSKIQVEIKEVFVKPVSTNTGSQLNYDADGADLTNE